MAVDVVQAVEVKENSCEVKLFGRWTFEDVSVSLSHSISIYIFPE